LLLSDSEDSAQIPKTDIGWLLLNAANGEFVKELIDERVVCDLLKKGEVNTIVGKPEQVPKVISWLLRQNRGEFSTKGYILLIQKFAKIS
jgi:hypothetical protein